MTASAKEIADAERELAKAKAKSLAASEARCALPPGSSRARVTTANARWMAAAEHRDRCEQRLADLKAVQP